MLKSLRSLRENLGQDFQITDEVGSIEVGSQKDIRWVKLSESECVNEIRKLPTVYLS